MRATKPDSANDAKPVEKPVQNPAGIVEEEEINIENGGDGKSGADKAAEESASGVKSLKPTIQSVIGNKWIRFGAIGLISLGAVYKLFISPMDDKPTKPIVVSAQNANPANAEINLKPRINGQIAAPSAPNPMLNQSDLNSKNANPSLGDPQMPSLEMGDVSFGGGDVKTVEFMGDVMTDQQGRKYRMGADGTKYLVEPNGDLIGMDGSKYKEIKPGEYEDSKGLLYRVGKDGKLYRDIIYDKEGDPLYEVMSPSGKIVLAKYDSKGRLEYLQQNGSKIAYVNSANQATNEDAFISRPDATGKREFLSDILGSKDVDAALSVKAKDEAEAKKEKDSIVNGDGLNDDTKPDFGFSSPMGPAEAIGNPTAPKPTLPIDGEVSASANGIPVVNSDNLSMEQKRQLSMFVITGTGPQHEQSKDKKQKSDFLIVNTQMISVKKPGDDKNSAGVGKVINMDTTLVQGKMIDAVLETGINSQLSGDVRAIISDDVYAEVGTKILLPKGSRVFGNYSSNVSNGQSRVQINFTRIIRPDGIDVKITAQACDQFGRTGIEGDVDNRVGESVANSLLLTLATLATGLVTQQLTKGEGQSQVVNANGTFTTTNITPLNYAAQSAIQTATNMTNQIIGNALSMTPIVTVPHGTKLKIVTTNDTTIPAFSPLLMK